jgi:protein gp37
MRARQRNVLTRAQYAGLTDENGKWNGQIRLLEKNLDLPLRARKPVVWAAWNDLFHSDVPDGFIDCVFAVMASSGQHTFLVLTKRPERMLKYMLRVAANGPLAASRYTEKLVDYFKQRIEKFTSDWTPPPPPEPEVRFIYDSAMEYEAADPKRESMFYNHQCHWRKWPLSNIYLGVTAENQEQADKRIPILLQIPAAVRFVSVEPMLGPVDLTRIGGDQFGWGRIDALYGLYYIRANAMDHGCDWETEPNAKLDLVFCGSESGPNRRKTEIDSIRSLRDQCVTSGTKFFLKQMEVDGKLVKMPELDGKQWSQFPEVQP